MSILDENSNIGNNHEIFRIPPPKSYEVDGEPENKEGERVWQDTVRAYCTEKLLLSRTTQFVLPG